MITTTGKSCVAVGSNQKESATVIQSIFPSTIIYHSPSLQLLKQSLKDNAHDIGLLILEDSISQTDFGEIVTELKASHNIPIVASLRNPTAQSMGNAILAGASGIVRGPIVDVHEITDAVNDALLAY